MVDTLTEEQDDTVKHHSKSSTKLNEKIQNNKNKTKLNTQKLAQLNLGRKN